MTKVTRPDVTRGRAPAVSPATSEGLLAEARRGGGDVVELPGTREEMGARLGTVRELVSRALGRLRAAGVITVRGRTVRVCDAARLAGFTGH